MCLNRISQIKDTNNQLIARYDYDIWDNRVAKTTYKDGQATTTYYFYNQDGLLAETNAQGLVTTQYGFAPSDSWQTNPLFIKTDRGYAYYHNDQLGTPRLATDKNGNVVWQADYSTNGEATLSSSNQITSNLRFPGQYFDTETSLHYNTRRYYDPSIGRYVTQDPIGFDGGLNLYNYVGGDPINNADPTGEILPAIAMGYARCVATCKVIQFASNKLGYCDDGNCFSDCLNPLNWVGGGVGRGANKARKLGSCALNSFTGDTPVHALDAEGNPKLVPISELKIGDLVLAKSEWKPEENSLSYEPITDIISTPNREQKWVHVTLSDGKVITATEGHPFRTVEGWRDAVLLKKGDILILTGSDGKPSTIQVDGIRYETKVLTTYNLEVANAHTFFVGEDGVLVHNGKWCGTYKEKSGGENWTLKVFDRIDPLQNYPIHPNTSFTLSSNLANDLR